MHKGVVTYSMVLVTELEMDGFSSCHRKKKNNAEKQRKGTLTPARLFCVFVLIDTHFLVLSLVDVCGEDNDKLLAGGQATYWSKGISLSKPSITCF